MQVALISPQDSLETNRAGPSFFYLFIFLKNSCLVWLKVQFVCNTAMILLPKKKIIYPHSLIFLILHKNCM